MRRSRCATHGCGAAQMAPLGSPSTGLRAPPRATARRAPSRHAQAPAGAAAVEGTECGDKTHHGHGPPATALVVKASPWHGLENTHSTDIGACFPFRVNAHTYARTRYIGLTSFKCYLSSTPLPGR
jgi:hypothetical protein